MGLGLGCGPGPGEDRAMTGKRKVGGGKAPKIKAAKRKTTKTVERKRLLWGVYSGSMKEEARFPYDQREDAEKKIEQLRARSTKKMYFIQPIKEVITDTPAPAEVKKKT